MTARLAALLAAAALAALAPAAAAHEGDPNYLSQIRAVTPATEGLTVEVLNRDDRLLLHNTSGTGRRDRGLRRRALRAHRAPTGGSRSTSTREAHYLNDDRFADVDVPAGVRREGPAALEGGRRARAASSGTTIASTGCRRRTPPQVRDESVRTKVLDWRIPIEVGGERGRDRRHAVLDAAPGRRTAARRDLRLRGVHDRLLPRRCSWSATGAGRHRSRGPPAEAW